MGFSGHTWLTAFPHDLLAALLAAVPARRRRPRCADGIANLFYRIRATNSHELIGQVVALAADDAWLTPQVTPEDRRKIPAGFVVDRVRNSDRVQP